MHKIDGAGHSSNTFTEGNPSGGVPATTVTGDWLNAVQSEIVNVITGAGIALSKPDNTQLAAAISKMIEALNKAVILPSATFAGGVADGNVVYWDAANTRFAKAVADGSAANYAVGVADVTNSRVIALGSAVLFSGLTPGARYFLSNGTPGAVTAIQPTANAVQVGIAKSATEMFVDPDESISQAAVPAGSVTLVAGSSAPSGWVKLNGALLSRTAYPSLWAFAQASGNISANDGAWTLGGFSPGDGSTTFRIPDARGVFLRAWADNGSTYDVARALGSFQADDNKAHTHSARATGSFSVGAGGFTETYTVAGNTGSSGGAEARPVNIALLAVIKY